MLQNANSGYKVLVCAVPISRGPIPYRELLDSTWVVLTLQHGGREGLV